MAESNVRRAVIREWTSVAREKRSSGEQAIAFAKNAVQRHKLARNRRSAQDIVMGWLRPRTGRP
jgi:rRNA-processing protein FCF1